jgi:tryptophanase
MMLVTIDQLELLAQTLSASAVKICQHHGGHRLDFQH